VASPRSDETAPTETAPLEFRRTVARDEIRWSRERRWRDVALLTQKRQS